MNFSGISNRSFFGKMLRAPLSLIPPKTTIPILQGKLRSKRWIVGSSQHGCWLGSYEFDKQCLFEKILQPGQVVFDLGAHVGFHTLLASTLVGSTGKVFAFEPMPENLIYLKEHLRLNKVTNVTVIEAAVSDRTGVASFELHPSSFQGHLSSQGTPLSSQGRLQVQTVSLDDLIARGEIPLPNCIKLDVEGAEVAVLNGAKTLLGKAHPVIVLATHGDDLQRECRHFLSSIGYTLKPIDNKEIDQADELIAQYTY